MPDRSADDYDADDRLVGRFLVALAILGVAALVVWAV